MELCYRHASSYDSVLTDKKIPYFLSAFIWFIKTVTQLDKKLSSIALLYYFQGNNGMIVRRGDVVKLVGPEAKTGLVKVKLEETGVIGFVPVENLVSV